MNIKKILKELFQIKLDTFDYNTIRRKDFLLLFSSCGIASIAIYSLIHFFYDKNIIMGFIMASGAIFMLLNLVLLKISRRVEAPSTFILIIYIVIFLASLINGGFRNSSLIWLMIFPLLSFYVKGKNEGLLFIISYLILSGIVIMMGELKLIKIAYSNARIFDIYLVFIVLVCMSYFYEKTVSRSEHMIKKQLITDNLTNLPNRTQLIHDILNPAKFELVLINIDDFKAINDLYGSKVGDRVLIEISDRLKAFANHSQVKKIYKLHADEFALLLSKKEENNTNLIKKLYKILTTSMLIHDLEIIICVSIGIADSESNILSDADKALKLAKEKKKEFIFFDKSMKITEEFENNLIWIKNLEKAIASDNIVPFYQPIIDNKKNIVDYYECLVRLINDEQVISPFYFLNVAKKSKIYSHITKIMFLKSCEKFKDTNFNFSLNISIDDILNTTTMHFIKVLLEEYNVAKQLTFELVESENIEATEEVTSFINDVKKMGSRIAIDDFGSGYSNFEYLLRMNVDFIKIDSTLIKNIATDRHSQIIVETIVDFTKKLNIKTIAEFVHTKSVYNKVRELEIDYSQGFYLGKPLPHLLTS